MGYGLLQWVVRAAPWWRPVVEFLSSILVSQIESGAMFLPFDRLGNSLEVLAMSLARLISTPV